MAAENIIPGRPSIVVARGGGGLDEYGGNLLSFVPRSSAAYATPAETMRMIRDFNPDAALAIWNFLRFVNPDSSFRVFNIGDRQKVDEEGQKMLERRCDDLAGVYGRDYGGGTSALIDVLTLTLVTSGAIAGELELSESLDDVLDWCPINPNCVTFVTDCNTGHYIPTYTHLGRAYEMPREQFRYIPLDPAVNEPYGRSPLWPAFETVFFQVEVLRDLKMVAHFAGHPRLSMTVVREIVESKMPRHYREPGREEDARAWMNNVLSEIASQYQRLKPDDALVCYDEVKPDSLDAGRPSYNIDTLIEVVEAQVFSALKQLPVLMGRHKGQGLAHGDIAWEIYAYGVQSLRRAVLAMMSWFGTQTLRVWGRPSICEFTIPTLRVRDRVKEAQAESIEFKTWLSKYLMGLITLEEMADKFAGHAPVARPDVFSALGKPELGSGGPRPIEPQQEETEMMHRFLRQAEPSSGCPSCDDRQEAEFFKVLPTWMRTRIGAVEQSLAAYSTVRREVVGAEVEGDE